MASQIAEIAALYRYPVKGLTAEELPEAQFDPHCRVPGDRAYAIEFRPTDIDLAAPEFRKKSFFYQLALFPEFARLKSRFDPRSAILELSVDGLTVARESLDTADGRKAVEDAVIGFLGRTPPHRPRLVDGKGVQFTDQSRPLVSVINLSTVAEIGGALAGDLDPLRFRGNVHLRGIPAWAENEWVGRTIALGGDVRARVHARIERCAATEVDRDSGERNRPVVETLRSAFGHTDCGIFIEITTGGRVAPGDTVQAAD